MKYQEMTASSISNSEATIPEHNSLIITPGDVTGITFKSELETIGIKPLPESEIKLSKLLSIDKFCVD